MAEQNNILGMLNAEDKLDGTNYPMWAYMMRHVLVAKKLRNINIESDRTPNLKYFSKFFLHWGTTLSSIPQEPTSSQLK